MTYKKTTKYFLSALFPTTLIATMLIPSILAGNHQSNKIDVQSVDTPANYVDLTTTEELDFEYIQRLNWTWPNDTYASTGGYKYTAVSNPNTEIFSINSQGFKVNPAFPKYSKGSDNGPTGTLYYGTTNHPIHIRSQAYNAANDSISGMVNNVSKTMHFGNTSSDTLTGLDNYELSAERPYLNVQFPIVDHRMINVTGISQGCNDYDHTFDHKSKEMLRYASNNSQFYNGNVKTINNHIKDPNNHQNPGGMNQHVYHWHYEFGVHEVNLSIFNDYDKNGNLLGVHLLNHGHTYNSVLPTVNIDSSKFDKSLSVIPQDVLAEGIVSLNNAQSIPAMGGAKMTAIKDPAAGTITFTYKPTYIFNNGVLQKYTGPGSVQVVSGFSILNTYIFPKTSYPDLVVVDKFIDSITNEDVIDASELGKYLDISTVPPGVTYKIPANTINTDLVAGTIEFKINASNAYNFDNSLSNHVSPDYPIKLQLTPRITQFNHKDFRMDDTLVSEFHDLVFDTTGQVDLSELKKYIDIKAPVDDAVYHLVPDSYNIHTGDGTAAFSLYASHYYDSNAQLMMGSSTNTATHFPLDLVLKPLPSTIAVKTVENPSTRVDHFIDAVSDANGNVTDLSLLQEYVELSHIPQAATYQINPTTINYDAYNDDHYYDHVEFDLTVDLYNESSFTPPTLKTQRVRVGLKPAHLQTRIEAKSSTDYDASIRLDRLLPKIIDDNNKVINRTLLEEYVNIDFLPKASILTIANINRTDATGQLDFDIVPTIAYDDDSNQLLNHSFPVSLALTIRHQPTLISGNGSIANPERVDRFASNLKALSGTKDLIEYLMPTDPTAAQYLIMSGDLPKAIIDTQFYVEHLEYADTGILSFDLMVSDSYDDDAETTINAEFPITLQLAQKFAPTQLRQLSNYPQASSVVEFETLVNSYLPDQIALRSFFSRFIEGIDTIPQMGDLGWNLIESNPTTGLISFTLTSDQYYDIDSDLQTGFESDTFSLNLIPNLQMATVTTNITWKESAPTVLNANKFFAIVNPNEVVDYNALATYLHLENVPVEAQLTITNKDPEFNSSHVLQFEIEIDQWWDEGSLKPLVDDEIKTKVYSFDISLLKFNTQSESLNFQWWWIAAGLAGLVLIGTSIFLAKHHKEEKHFRDTAIGL